MKIKITGFILLLLFLLNGCSANHLVYVQETSFGLVVAVGTEGTQKLSLGYDRDVYSIVPTTGDGKDAMSLFSVNNVEVAALDDLRVSEFVAGGNPAKALAKDPDTISRLRHKIFGR